MSERIALDPYCALHGKRASDHELGFYLFCCLCFKPLTLEECSITVDGERTDVCRDCAEREADAA